MKAVQFAECTAFMMSAGKDCQLKHGRRFATASIICQSQQLSMIEYFACMVVSAKN